VHQVDCQESSLLDPRYTTCRIICDSLKAHFGMCKYKAYATCSVHALLENKEYKGHGYNTWLANKI
jgi:hypothetical protein